MGLDARYVRDWSDHVWTEVATSFVALVRTYEQGGSTHELIENGWGEMLAVSGLLG